MTATDGDQILQNIKAFYNRFPFPGYEVDEYYTVNGLYERASPYVRAIDEQIPVDARVLDIGCGTGQFSALLSVRGREVTGVDLSAASIEKANELKRRLGLKTVAFLERNLFKLDLPSDAFDVVFCNGVLHHTSDPEGGFNVMVAHARPGGYVVVGLYNTYGRLLMQLRGVILRLAGAQLTSSLAKLDYFLRRRDVSATQKQSWFEDQYHNPHETVHSVGEVLGWFDQSGVDFVNCIPDPRLYGSAGQTARYFGEPGRRPAGWEALLAQLGWIFSTEQEGGYFLMFGRKRGGDERKKS